MLGEYYSAAHLIFGKRFLDAYGQPINHKKAAHVQQSVTNAMVFYEATRIHAGEDDAVQLAYCAMVFSLGRVSARGGERDGVDSITLAAVGAWAICNFKWTWG